MKNWWSSKTVWFGVIATTIGAVELIFRTLGSGVPPVVYEIELIAGGILAIIFRKVTSTKLSKRLLP